MTASASTINLKAMAAAIAAAFAPAQITPPTGEDPIISSTHLFPDAIGNTPRILVWPPRPAEFEYDPGMREGILVWPVRFFYHLNGLQQRMEGLYDWATVLMARYPVSSEIDLGLGSYVRLAYVGGFAITTFRYGLNPDDAPEYPIIEIPVVTHVGEPL
jgi:hypothetical protein